MTFDGFDLPDELRMMRDVAAKFVAERLRVVEREIGPEARRIPDDRLAGLRAEAARDDDAAVLRQGLADGLSQSRAISRRDEPGHSALAGLLAQQGAVEGDDRAAHGLGLGDHPGEARGIV